MEAVKIHLTNRKAGLFIPGLLHVGGVDIELCAVLRRDEGHPVVFQRLAAGGGRILHRLARNEGNRADAAHLLHAAGAVMSGIGLDAGAQGEFGIDLRICYRAADPICQKYRLAAEVHLTVGIAVVIAVHISGHDPRPVFAGSVVRLALLGGAVHMEVGILPARLRLLSHFRLIGQQNDLVTERNGSVFHEDGEGHTVSVILSLVSGAEELGGDIGLTGRFLQGTVEAHVGGDILRGIVHLRAVMVIRHGEEVVTVHGIPLSGFIFDDVDFLDLIIIAVIPGSDDHSLVVFRPG